MVDLSIIIVSYNTAQITLDCLNSIVKSLDNRINYEIIIIDNASSDNSIQNIKYQISNIKNTYQKSNISFKLIENKTNTGFARANNQGVKVAQGKYILFINSDVVVEKIDFQELVAYFEKNAKVGALTVMVNLQKNGIDPASHRGFPTLWRSFTYFTGLERFLAKFSFFKKVFGGYHLLHNNLNEIHEIDSPSGALMKIFLCMGRT